MREALKQTGLGQQVQRTQEAWQSFRDRREENPTKHNLFQLLKTIKTDWHDRLRVSQLDDMVDSEGNSVIVEFSNRSNTLGYFINNRYVSEDAGKSTEMKLTVDQPLRDTGISVRTKFKWDDFRLSQDQLQCKVLVIDSSSQEPISRYQEATIFRGRKPANLSDAWFEEPESRYPRCNFTDEQLQIITARAYQVAFNQLRRRIPVQVSFPELPFPTISQA